MKGARVQSVAFSPDGRRLACGGSYGFFKVLDVERWEVAAEATFKH